MNTIFPRILAAGSRALLVELPDLDTVLSWHAALSAQPLYGQVETVPATNTLLVITDSALATKRAALSLKTFNPPVVTNQIPQEITIPVIYDGEDLAEVAASQEMSIAALIDWHTNIKWRGGFGGFAPGFTYCFPAIANTGLEIARRDSPRTTVPAGAVALAGEFSAIYPRQSPGGWQLIGTTATPMWDSQAQPPALIQPGDIVSYQAVREFIEISAPINTAAPLPAHKPTLKILDPGLYTVIEDGGRPGFARLGVTTSGFADRASAAVANRVVGNPTTAAALENIGGLSLISLVDTVVAVTGAETTVTINSVTVPLGSPQLVPAGSTVEISPQILGARNYVAVRGGLICAQELESAATDVLAGLGPAALETNDILNTPTQISGSVNLAEPNPLRVTLQGGTTHGTIRVNAGPRDNWFESQTAALTSQLWQVSPQSNRVGLRLKAISEKGETLPSPIVRKINAELPSEGLVAGAIQVPPNGEPVLFLRDHAVTGGYPIIATVYFEDLDVAAQLPPGSTVSFVLAPSPLQEP
ncbi:KipI antagonist [Corynebacterium caspium DSM 44850]|nr:carboxyltransferase domain-containing protein [Corynebacterium caspium]WKD59592.1 KipI antagonist [Corynebacterium caspium DSM 44850]